MAQPVVVALVCSTLVFIHFVRYDGAYSSQYIFLYINRVY